jgi:tetratricopeptide (TPR) repeat protein
VLSETAAAPDQPTSDQPASEQSQTGQPSDDFDDYEPLTPELVEEEAIRGDFVMRWAVVLMAFLLGSTRIVETPTLVHIKTGQYLANNGILPPRQDVFSYTAADRPWANLAWLFDLVIAGLHGIGQFPAISVAKALIISLAFWLIGRISRPGTPTWWGSICSVLALLSFHTRVSAQPTLVTLLGLALVMTLVFELRQFPSRPTGGSKRLWLLVPLFLVWCNLDPRAWLGLVFLLLYAIGDALGAWLQSPVALPSESRKQLWQVTGASVAATLVHPFWWKSLAAPWLIYAVEYPAVRDYIQETVLESERVPTVSTLLYFPMTTEAFWLNLNLAAIAALAILALTLVACALNRSRLDCGHVMAYLGFVLLAVVCLHELPAAAVVAGVIATLNGQEWYATRCRQSYSIETGELVFSRGGRALTVICFALIGFLGGTGRLRDPSAGRPGFGLDYNLGMQLGDLEKQLGGAANFDDRPFNTLLAQGDQLIWLGQRVFADSRVGVYYSPDDDDNLLDLHLKTREALRPRRAGDVQKPSEGPRNLVWRRTFDRYDITHIVIRLASNRDYEMLSELLQESRNWEWTGLGPTAAVFYRANVKGRELEKYKEFVAAHKVDFRKRAYQGTERLEYGRDRGIRPPSFYKQHFWSTKVEAPAEVHEAMQLVVLAKFQGLPRRLDASRAAMTYLAIRLAQSGLSKDPDAVTGYLALGEAYDFLSQLEYSTSRGLRQPRNGVRYLQAVAAYNQSLIGDPANVAAHKALVKLYGEARRLDLVLRHLLEIDKQMAAHPEAYSEDDVLNTGKQIGQLEKLMKQYEDEITQQVGSNPNPLAQAEGFLQRGCLLRALKEFEVAGAQTAGNPQFEQLRVTLLLEVGRVDEAYEAAGRFVQMAQKAGLADSGEIMGVACLPQADYDGAMERWLTAAAEVERRMLQKIVLTLPPRLIDPNAPWPVSTTRVATENFFQTPETVAGLKIDVALVCVESGKMKEAQQYFHEALADSPDSQSRPFIAYYLYDITDGKEEIDMVPPSDRVSEMFAPDEGE